MFTYLPYQQLKAQSDGFLTYLELLMTTEWKQKRMEILGRDSFNCSVCKNGETIMYWDKGSGKIKPHSVFIPEDCRKQKVNCQLGGEPESFYIYDSRQMVFTKVENAKRMHVHHRYYMEGCLPWNYEADALQTMCEHCHYDYHQSNKVKVFTQTNDGLEVLTELDTCMRCGGAGRLPEFDYVQGGICFRCWGACYEQWITPALVERSKRVYERYKKMNA